MPIVLLPGGSAASLLEVTTVSSEAPAGAVVLFDEAVVLLLLLFLSLSLALLFLLLLALLLLLVLFGALVSLTTAFLPTAIVLLSAFLATAVELVVVLVVATVLSAAATAEDFLAMILLSRRSTIDFFTGGLISSYSL